MWFRNNLIKIGKRGELSFVIGVTITTFIFMFGGNFFAYAYMSSEDAIPSNSSQETYPSSINKISDATLPVNNLINEAIKGFRFNQNVNIGTGIPTTPKIDFNKFFSSSNVSSNDLTSFLKEAAITGINLTILVISITTQILKGLLGALK